MRIFIDAIDPGIGSITGQRKHRRKIIEASNDVSFQVVRWSMLPSVG